MQAIWNSTLRPPSSAELERLAEGGTRPGSPGRRPPPHTPSFCYLNPSCWQALAMSSGSGARTVIRHCVRGCSRVMDAACRACRPSHGPVSPYKSSPMMAWPACARCTCTWIKTVTTTTSNKPTEGIDQAPRLTLIWCVRPVWGLQLIRLVPLAPARRAGAAQTAGCPADRSVAGAAAKTWKSVSAGLPSKCTRCATLQTHNTRFEATSHTLTEQ